MGPALIELKGMTCSSEEGVLLFEDAHLSLHGGEKALITGPPASGKGLLIDLIAGLARPTRGAVLLFGRDIAALDINGLNGVRMRIGFVLGGNVLISNLKAVENAALPLIYHSRLPYRESMERAMTLLDLVGYEGDPWALPGHLSPRARKEVCVARAMSMEPDIIVCEDFSEGLAENERQRLSAVIAEYHSASPERLLVLTAGDGAEARLFKPGRLIRIEGRGFKEA